MVNISAPAAANTNAVTDFNFVIPKLKNHYDRMGNGSRKAAIAYLTRARTPSAKLKYRQKQIIDFVKKQAGCPISADEIAHALNHTNNITHGWRYRHQPSVEKNSLVDAAGVVVKHFTKSEVYKTLRDTKAGFELLLSGCIAITVNTTRPPGAFIEAAIFSILSLGAKKKNYEWPIDHVAIRLASKVYVKCANIPNYEKNSVFPLLSKTALKQGYTHADILAAIATRGHVLENQHLLTALEKNASTVALLLQSSGSAVRALQKVARLTVDNMSLTGEVTTLQDEINALSSIAAE